MGGEGGALVGFKRKSNNEDEAEDEEEEERETGECPPSPSLKREGLGAGEDITGGGAKSDANEELAGREAENKDISHHLG